MIGLIINTQSLQSDNYKELKILAAKFLILNGLVVKTFIFEHAEYSPAHNAFWIGQRQLSDFEI